MLSLANVASGICSGTHVSGHSPERMMDTLSAVVGLEGWTQKSTGGTFGSPTAWADMVIHMAIHAAHTIMDLIFGLLAYSTILEKNFS